jgi:HTH-type transcriptional regulator/antitoxin HigA
MPRLKSELPRRLPSDLESLVRLHPPLAIHDEVAYRNTQEMIDALTSLPRLSKGQMQYLDTLTILFEAYEDEYHGLHESAVTPLAALRFLLKEHRMSASELGRLLGERSLGSKILTGERTLSKTHIRILADHFKVSSDLFL